MAGIINPNGGSRKNSRLHAEVDRPVFAGKYNEKSLIPILPQQLNNEEEEIQPHTRNVLIQPKRQYAVARKGGPSPTSNTPVHPSKTQPVPIPVETPMKTVQRTFPPSFMSNQETTAHPHTSDRTTGRWSKIKRGAAGY